MLIDDEDDDDDLFEEDDNNDIQFLEDLSDVAYRSPVKLYCMDCHTIALVQITEGGRVAYCPVCGSSADGDEDDVQ